MTVKEGILTSKQNMTQKLQKNIEQLSVNGKRMCAKYWLPASGRLAQEQCG